MRISAGSRGNFLTLWMSEVFGIYGFRKTRQARNRRLRRRESCHDKNLTPGLLQL